MSREDQVGIMCYVHADLPGFTGILKQRYERCTASLAGFTDHRRYNDFLVNEVTEEGEVLHLTSTELPAEEAPTPPPAPHSIDTLLQRTAALLGQPQADKLKAWLQVCGVRVTHMQSTAHHPGCKGEPRQQTQRQATAGAARPD